MVLPGRNPIVLAKELATLDRLSNGRLLPAFGLGVADPHEQQAFGVERCARAKLFDEALAVLRGAWAEGNADPPRRALPLRRRLRVLPKPLPVAPRRLAGRHRAIGTAPGRSAGRRMAYRSFVTPDDARAGRETIEAALAEHDRSIDDDHYGALISYTLGRSRNRVVDVLAKRRPDLADPTVLVPQGWDALMATIDEFVAVGTTKFVILPIVEPGHTTAMGRAPRAGRADRARPTDLTLWARMNGQGPAFPKHAVTRGPDRPRPIALVRRGLDGGRRRYGGGDLDHARATGAAGASRQSCGPLGPDVRSLRGADAAALQPQGLPARRQDRRTLAGAPGKCDQRSPATRSRTASSFAPSIRPTVAACWPRSRRTRHRTVSDAATQQLNAAVFRSCRSRRRSNCEIYVVSKAVRRVSEISR